MKIRYGFVSNSSSSSFVLIVLKNGHNKVLAQIPEEYHEILDAVVKKTKIFGQDAVEYATWSDQSGSYGYEDDLDVEFPSAAQTIAPEGIKLNSWVTNPEDANELMEAYMEIAKVVAKNQYFEHSIDY